MFQILNFKLCKPTKKKKGNQDRNKSQVPTDRNFDNFNNNNNEPDPDSEEYEDAEYDVEDDTYKTEEENKK